MFKLIKLAVYAFMGYALYEFFQGLLGETSHRATGGATGRGTAKDSGAEAWEREGRSYTRSGGSSQFTQPSSSRQQSAGGQVLTGGGEGMNVATEGADGGGASHTVGRGVISR